MKNLGWLCLLLSVCCFAVGCGEPSTSTTPTGTNEPLPGDITMPPDPTGTAAPDAPAGAPAETKKDAPAPEAPKADAPPAEAPKADAPKAEAPKAEAPKADAPKAEAPKADAPKKE